MVRVVKQRGKNPETKRGVNMSFRELVQRIDQGNTNGAKPGLENSKQSKTTPKLRKRQKK